MNAFLTPVWSARLLRGRGGELQFRQVSVLCNCLCVCVSEWNARALGFFPIGQSQSALVTFMSPNKGTADLLLMESHLGLIYTLIWSHNELVTHTHNTHTHRNICLSVCEHLHWLQFIVPSFVQPNPNPNPNPNLNYNKPKPNLDLTSIHISKLTQKKVRTQNCSQSFGSKGTPVLTRPYYKNTNSYL